MQPWPPWAMNPSAVASSPDSWLKSATHRRPLLRDPHHVGGRILDAGDVLELEQPAMVSTDMSITERGGML